MPFSRLNPFYGFWRSYIARIEELAAVVSTPARAHLPPPLVDPGLAIAYSDPSRRHVLRLTSRAECSEIEVAGDVLSVEGYTSFRPVGLMGDVSIERFLFPNVEDHDKPIFHFSDCDLALRNLAFSETSYAEKYWRGAPYTVFMGGKIPFRVTGSGSLIALNLLHGFEERGERQEQVLEYVKVFSDAGIIPRTETAIRDLAFHDFLAAFTKSEELSSWSFSEFLAALAGPLERNVLLLGSYREPTDFERLKGVLSSFGYNGLLLRDAPDLPNQTNLEKLVTAIVLSRFVIVIDTQPSGHLAEVMQLLQMRFKPVIILRFGDKPSTWFVEDKIRTDDYFRVEVVPSISEQSLLPALSWAKAKTERQTAALNSINHWRKA
jgi:hypothetical protein